MNLEERKNYYDVLEIPQTATLQEIHNAHNRVKNAYSGDTAALYSIMTQNECDQILNQIEEAYSVLGVPEKRREYDKARGFNQMNTPQGFNDNISTTPAYRPNSDLEKETLSVQISQTEQLRSEDNFKYSEAPKNEASISKVQAFKKFGLNFKQNSQFEQEIENCEIFTGEFLKRIREYKDVTIERMSEMTKISKTYIKTIENDDFEKLPADVYTRGFVYQYAKCLKLNSDLVAASYLNYYKENKLLDVQ